MKKPSYRTYAWSAGVLVAAGIGFLAGKLAYGPVDEGRRVYATLNGKAIRGADVMDQVQGDLEQLEKLGYRIRRQAVESWVRAKLRPSKGTAIPTGELDVSDAEIDKYLKDRNQSRAKLSAVQLHDIAGNLRVQKQFQREKKEDADRLAQANLQWMLPLPVDRRISLTSGWSPRLGSGSPTASMIFVGNFHCPACAEVDQRARRLQEKYPGRLSLSFRFAMEEPLDSIVRITAEAAKCAHDQGQFWAFHDRLMAEKPVRTIDELLQNATALKLDAGAFQNCVKERRHRDDVQSDLTETRAAGVDQIPSLVIKDHLLSGPVSLEETELVLSHAL